MILTECVNNFKETKKLGFDVQAKSDIGLAKRCAGYGDSERHFELARDQIPNPYRPIRNLLDWIAFDLGKAEH